MQSGADAAAESGSDPGQAPTLDAVERSAFAASALRVLLFDAVRDASGEVVDFRPVEVRAGVDPGLLPDPPPDVPEARLGGADGLVPEVCEQVLDSWRTVLLTGVPDERVVWIPGVDGRTGTSWYLMGFVLGTRLGVAGRPQGPATDARAGTPDAFLAQSLLAAGVSSWEWDPDADALRWISAPPGLLGLTAAGAPLRLADFLTFVHQVDRGGLERAMRGSLATRTAFRAQFRVGSPTNPAQAGGGRRAAGGRTEVLAGKPPPAGDVDPDDGSLILRMAGNATIEGGRRRVVGVLEDVTDATRARQALTQNQRLASLGQLAAGIAHDFNNVLTVVTMRADMLKAAAGDSRSAQSEEDAVAILDAAARASALTRQLMLFAGHQGGRSADIAIGEVVNDLRPLVEAMREDTFATAYEISPSPPVSTDRVHIEQIVVNLALNARDALREVPRPPNRPLLLTIAVRGQAEDPRGPGDRVPPPAAPPGGRPPPASWVVLEVIDTGEGMDHATLARALDPFFTTKPVGAGTGLGLSVVHGLVEQLGGSMTVESVAGSGTTVRVLLPGTRPLGLPETGSRPERPVGARDRIVVVDDDEAVRAVTARSLAMNGFEVVQAANAEQALAALAREPGIVALVSDIVMPRMSGTDLAARVLADYPGVPVLLVTGYTPPTDLIVHPRLSLVTKPLTGARLAQSLRDLLDRVAAAAATTESWTTTENRPEGP